MTVLDAIGLLIFGFSKRAPEDRLGPVVGLCSLYSYFYRATSILKNSASFEKFPLFS